MSELRKAIRKMALDNLPDTCNAEVISVDKEKNTVEVKVLKTDVTLPDVTLLSIEGNPKNKMVVYPVKGSIVTIEFMGKTDEAATVIKVNEVESVLIGGDQFGGLVKVEALVGKINDLEDKVNSVIEKWNTFAAAYTPGSPSALGTPPTLATSILSILVKTLRSEVENEIVKHG